MKMVSQLTRQAMNRHLILSASPPFPAVSASIPKSVPDFSPAEPPSVPCFSAPEPPPLPQPPAPGVRPSMAPRPATIYQQLMTSHDRMTERHLSRT